MIRSRTLLSSPLFAAALSLVHLPSAWAQGAPPAPPPPPSTPAPAATDNAAPTPAPPAPPPVASEPPAAPPETPEANAAPPADVPQDQGDVVKVTVDRREKRVQDYAGSATVFSNEQLSRVGINNVRTLSNATPFVQLGEQEANTEIFIRGVGSDNNTELGDPAVATHIDGVYIPRPRGVGAMLFDLERIEINRGPQGTLRGRNSEGGSVNIITNKPKFGTWESKLALQYGNFSQKLTEGMVNIPIDSMLAVRLASYSENHDPYDKNAGPIQTIKPTDDADVLAYRASIRFVPTKAVKLDVVNDYLQERGTGDEGTNFAPALQAGLTPQEVPDPRAIIYRGAQGSADSVHWGVHGDLNLDFGPVLVEALSSYRFLKYEQQTPGNAGVAFPGMPAPDLDNWSSSFWHVDSASTVNELRIFAPDTDRFRWTVGAFYFDETQHAFLGQINDKTTGYAGGEFNMNHMLDSAYAGYADGTFDVFKHFRATGGIRYTHEQKMRTGIGNNYNIDNNPNNTVYRIGTEGFSFAQFDRTNYGNTGTGAQVFQNGVANFGARDTIQNASISSSGFAVENGTYSDNFVDWRGVVDYDLAKDHLVYLNVATAHKSGGFNDNVNTPSGVSIAATYKPESLYTVEAGSKNEFLGGKYRLNVAAFDTEFTDQQVQTVQVVVDPGNPNATGFATAVRSNAAQSRILGLEIEGNAHLPFGLVANVQAQIMDARFRGGSKLRDSRLGFGAGDSPIVSIDGNFLPRASQLTMNYSLAHSFKTEVGYFDWVVSAQTRSKYFMTAFNGEGFDSTGRPNPNLTDVVPTYTRIDAGIGFTRPDGNLRLELIGSNLTDAVYMTSLINTPGLNLRFFNPPRTLAVRLTLYM